MDGWQRDRLGQGARDLRRWAFHGTCPRGKAWTFCSRSGVWLVVR